MAITDLETRRRDFSSIFSRLRRSAPRELPGVATSLTELVPDLYRTGNLSPDPSITALSIESFRGLIKAQLAESLPKDENRRLREVVGVYPVRREGLLPPRYFYQPFTEKPDDPQRKNIPIRIDPPPKDPITGKFEPVRVGLIMHTYLADSLPMPPNLKHLLLQIQHFAAAGAAVILTPRDIYVVCRGSNTPQFEYMAEAKAYLSGLVGNFDADSQRLIEAGKNTDPRVKATLAQLYRDLGLQLFHGSINRQVIGKMN